MFGGFELPAKVKCTVTPLLQGLRDIPTTWKFLSMADETTGVSLSTNHIQGKEIEGTSSENPVKLEEEEAHEEPATPTHEIQAETEEGGALDNTIHDNTVEEALGVSASDLNMTTSKESGAELLSKATAAEPEQNGMQPHTPKNIILYMYIIQHAFLFCV